MMQLNHPEKMEKDSFTHATPAQGSGAPAQPGMIRAKHKNVPGDSLRLGRPAAKPGHQAIIASFAARPGLRYFFTNICRLWYSHTVCGQLHVLRGKATKHAHFSSVNRSMDFNAMGYFNAMGSLK